jgi:putative ABC transport system substrate-binding protein
MLTLLGGAAGAWPLAARAQGQRMRRIGVLISIARSDAQTRVKAFEQALQKLGWAEGSSVRIDYRWAGGDTDLIRAYAAAANQINDVERATEDRDGAGEAHRSRPKA